MMDISMPHVIVALFGVLLMALVLALIFSGDFRSAVLGGTPGEASIGGIITVKGVAIVLLCALFIGAIMLALEKVPVKPDRDPTTGPFDVRLNVHFEPNEVNPRNPSVKARVFIKTPEGDMEIDKVPKVAEGALSVSFEIPDMETPYFIRFETPDGVWVTDDHSIRESAATARRQAGLSPP